MAIISVLIYLLIVSICEHIYGNGASTTGDSKTTTTTTTSSSGVGLSMNQTEWYKSVEILMLISVFIGYYVNAQIYCGN
jgi:hypothetical protein